MPGPPNRPPRRLVVVADVARTTPRTVRVTVRGELADWPEPGPAAHMKVFLPDTPAGPVMRTYTVRRFDRERGEVVVDFTLHEGDGPAARWAARVAPGAGLELAGRSRSTFEPVPDGGTYLFAGDESALPAIATCLEALPSSAKATAVVEVADRAEEQPLRSAAALDVRWLHRDAGETLADAVADASAATAYTQVWVACEADVMRAIRRALLDAGYSKEALKTRGYWKRGESDHPDHDTGEDLV